MIYQNFYSRHRV